MIAILDYRAGNLTSVERALRHLGFACQITDNHDVIRGAERIIFPGVGAAGKSMENLKELGLDLLLHERFQAGVPILGICVGLQVLFDHSEENDTPCLGLLPGRVRLFRRDMPDPAWNDGHALKIPHMGWSAIAFTRPHPVFADVPPKSEFYFVHSYYPDPQERDHVIGNTEYGIPFASAVAWKNLAAMQFHPEKSGTPGLRILQNFCLWNGHWQ